MITTNSMTDHTVSTPKLVPNNSLLTPSAEEGRALALHMARLIVKATQPDAAIREKLREVYANDAAMLIQITHVTAVEFATIAAANDYWRETREH
jgi:hypothetical protein